MPDHSHKLLAQVFYRPLEDENHPRWRSEITQKICLCNHVQQKPASGYTALGNHVRKKHLPQQINEKVALFKNKQRSELRSSNKAGALRHSVNVKPIVSNATQWSSVYQMLHRYTIIHQHIDTDDADIVPFLLSPIEH